MFFLDVHHLLQKFRGVVVIGDERYELLVEKSSSFGPGVPHVLTRHGMYLFVILHNKVRHCQV